MTDPYLIALIGALVLVVVQFVRAERALSYGRASAETLLRERNEAIAAAARAYSDRDAEVAARMAGWTPPSPPVSRYQDPGEQKL